MPNLMKYHSRSNIHIQHLWSPGWRWFFTFLTQISDRRLVTTYNIIFAFINTCAVVFSYFNLTYYGCLVANGVLQCLRFTQVHALMSVTTLSFVIRVISHAHHLRMHEFNEVIPKCVPCSLMLINAVLSSWTNMLAYGLKEVTLLTV